MEKEINEEKRAKFIDNAGKRVNNVLHGIQILEPMARSNTYDFKKQDVDEMFEAMQCALNDAKDEYYKKFEEKAKSAKKVFSFGNTVKQEENVQTESENQTQNLANTESINENIEDANQIQNNMQEQNKVEL